MITILSDSQQKVYAEYMAKTIEALEERPVSGLAVVALCKDGRHVTSYWNMNVQDKCEAEMQIRFDAIDDFISANVDRYLPDEGDCEDDMDDE